MSSENAIKFHGLFMDEYILLFDAFSYILSEANHRETVEFCVEVNTPGVSPSLSQQIL